MISSVPDIEDTVVPALPNTYAVNKREIFLTSDCLWFEVENIKRNGVLSISDQYLRVTN
jgi:hypothetical protein